jgi:hypothetical protein
VERSTWTDERLDDMVARHETQFELLRTEMRDTRTDLAAEMREMRSELAAEMREGFAELRGEMSKVRRDMLHLTIGMIGAFAALFAALLAQSL